MIYTEQGETITLEMTIDDYGELLIMLGYAIGAMPPGSVLQQQSLEFVDEMNRTNPRYQAYTDAGRKT